MATFHIFQAFIPPTEVSNRSIKELVHSEIAKTQGLLRRWMYVKRLWGPRVWYYIHKTAYAYKRNSGYNEYQKSILEEWVKQVYHLIPCSTCRRGYRKYVNRYSIVDICSTGNIFFEFFHRFHNHVNQKIGLENVSLEESIERLLAI